MNELFKGAHRTFEVVLAFEDLYKAIGCQVCNVLFLFLSKGSYENLELQGCGICFRITTVSRT